VIYYVIKVLLTACIIVAISEVSSRNNTVAALLASIPMVSVLAIIWIYIERGDIAQISALSTGIFWLVLPSLAFFIVLPLCLKQGLSFTVSLLVAMGLTALCYGAMLWLLKQFGIQL
jgi:hypothetical protein